jgi:uncharacterized membrane protein
LHGETEVEIGLAAALAVSVVVALAGWLYLRGRVAELERSIRRLEAERLEAPVVPAVIAPAPTPESKPGAPGPILSPPPILYPPPSASASDVPHADWETVLGGNWLNKLGVLIFVIGLALALGYSFTRLGPAGRVGISLFASFAMLSAGVAFEAREPYRTFARGLLGGGWAGLYTTVYAMQAIPAALVIHDPLAGALLLLAVAAGMIAHSLRYQSQTVTGVAYFVAFATLAITQITWLSVLALLPLAASLLFVAYRLEWRQIAVFGLAATWTITLLRGDTGAPLWQAQVLLAIYWLLFEAFDLLRADAVLLPLNAAGALGLSLMKWQSDARDQIWWFFSLAAAAYLASTLARAARRSEWRPAATLSAALAAAAIFLRLHHQWIALGLLVEAELIYLTGWRVRAWYLRVLGTGLAGLHLLYLVIAAVGALSLDAWIPVAVVAAAVFYANRALTDDVAYGFAGAGMLALIAGYEIAEPQWGSAWMALGVAAFAVGWSQRLFDFRAQGYALAVLGGTAAALYAPRPPLALVVAAAVWYGAALAVMRSGPGRFGPAEGTLLHRAGSIGGTFFVAELLWLQVSGSVLTVAWGVQGAVLLAAGFPLRDRVLRISGLALLLTCILKLFLWDLRELEIIARIISFLVLGLILVGVSWVYTRFRERVARYL